MQFFTTIALLAGAAVTMAAPAVLERQDATLCSGLDGTPLCCAVDVLGVADLQCANPPSIPTDIPNFIAICNSIGQEARCCALPVLDQALICGAPL